MIKKLRELWSLTKNLWTLILTHSKLTLHIYCGLKQLHSPGSIMTLLGVEFQPSALARTPVGLTVPGGLTLGFALNF